MGGDTLPVRRYSNSLGFPAYPRKRLARSARPQLGARVRGAPSDLCFRGCPKIANEVNRLQPGSLSPLFRFFPLFQSGVSSTLPTFLRSVRRRCASAACENGNVESMRGLIFPSVA